MGLSAGTRLGPYEIQAPLGAGGIGESKKPQVYVQAFPGPGPKIQVSSDGGTDPVWKRTGGELYFRNRDKMMAVVVSTTPTTRSYN
jgi:hypothetical protein